MIEFYLSQDSGVAPYLQIVRQVRQAIRLGILKKGDQLPTVKEVVASLAINPNTVLKAYKELEHAGLAAARPGIGTFVTAALPAGQVAAHGAPDLTRRASTPCFATACGPRQRRKSHERRPGGERPR